MFAVVEREELATRKYRGMNPEFVRRVWAKRREMVKQSAERPKPEKSSRMQMYLQKAVERERERERKRVERLKARMEEGGVRGIMAEVALAHGVTIADILGRSRAHPIVKARHQAIIELALRRPAMSLPQIGRHFSRDHTTILHVLRKYGIRQETTP